MPSFGPLTANLYVSDSREHGAVFIQTQSQQLVSIRMTGFIKAAIETPGNPCAPNPHRPSGVSEIVSQKRE